MSSTPIEQPGRHAGDERQEEPASTPTAGAAESSETALPAAARFRAALLGVALAILAALLTVPLALLIVTGPFHTALGDIF